MKFLVLVRIRRDAQITVELAGAHTRAILEGVEKGLAESVYIFAGRGVPDGMMIVNADTPEQLNKVVLSAPGFSVCDLEVYPLADFAKAADDFIDMLHRSAAYR
jgi:hypothetical protein